MSNEVFDFVRSQDVLQFGSFKLKSGRESPYFFNLGKVSAGKPLKRLGELFGYLIRDKVAETCDVGAFMEANKDQSLRYLGSPSFFQAELKQRYERVVVFGPAYKGFTIAVVTACALEQLLGLPVHYSSLRKETKTHGDRGDFIGFDLSAEEINPDRTLIVLVDDVITTGETKLVAVEHLTGLNYKVEGCFVAMDRQEVADDEFASAAESFTDETGVPVHSLLDFLSVFRALVGDEATLMRDYGQRFGTRALKKELPGSRIIVALDGVSTQDAKELIQKLRGFVWGFKANDLFLKPGFLALLEANKDINWFLDLKLHDIPNTVLNQTLTLAAIYPEAKFVTIHASGWVEMMKAALKGCEGSALNPVAVTALTSLSDDDCNHLFAANNSAAVVRRLVSAAYKDAGIRHFVCSAKEVREIKATFPDAICVVPGIRLAGADANDQQRVGTPAGARAAGAAYIVVGRYIVQSEYPVAAAKEINADWFSAYDPQDEKDPVVSTLDDDDQPF